MLINNVFKKSAPSFSFCSRFFSYLLEPSKINNFPPPNWWKVYNSTHYEYFKTLLHLLHRLNLPYTLNPKWFSMLSFEDFPISTDWIHSSDFDLPPLFEELMPRDLNAYPQINLEDLNKLSHIDHYNKMIQHHWPNDNYWGDHISINESESSHQDSHSFNQTHFNKESQESLLKEFNPSLFSPLSLFIKSQSQKESSNNIKKEDLHPEISSLMKDLNIFIQNLPTINIPWDYHDYIRKLLVRHLISDPHFLFKWNHCSLPLTASRKHIETFECDYAKRYYSNINQTHMRGLSDYQLPNKISLSSPQTFNDIASPLLRISSKEFIDIYYSPNTTEEKGEEIDLKYQEFLSSIFEDTQTDVLEDIEQIRHSLPTFSVNNLNDSEIRSQLRKQHYRQMVSKWKYRLHRRLFRLASIALDVKLKRKEWTKDTEFKNLHHFLPTTKALTFKQYRNEVYEKLKSMKKNQPITTFSDWLRNMKIWEDFFPRHPIHNDRLKKTSVFNTERYEVIAEELSHSFSEWSLLERNPEAWFLLCSCLATRGPLNLQSLWRKLHRNYHFIFHDYYQFLTLFNRVKECNLLESIELEENNEKTTLYQLNNLQPDPDIEKAIEDPAIMKEIGFDDKLYHQQLTSSPNLYDDFQNIFEKTKMINQISIPGLSSNTSAYQPAYEQLESLITETEKVEVPLIREIYTTSSSTEELLGPWYSKREFEKGKKIF